MTNEEFMDEFLATIVGVAEFKPGDQVKWVDPDNELEMIFGEVVEWSPRPDRTSVRHYGDDRIGWIYFVKTADLYHAHEVDRPRGLVEPIAEKKGYEPDGFDREAFDDFMRNL